MSIIEKEIARRESMIADKAEKEKLVAEMEQEIARLNAEFEQEIARLNAEIESTDVDALKAEIDELETYLPRPEPLPEVEAPADPYAMYQ